MMKKEPKSGLLRDWLYCLRIPLRPLPAFTIVEMLIGMALSALLVTLGFYALQMLQKQYAFFVQASEESIDYQRFTTIVRHDVAQATCVEADTGMIRCQMRDKRLEYIFQADKIIRLIKQDTIFTDTLSVRAHVDDLKFKGHFVSSGLIDECTISLFPFGEQGKIGLEKIYSAYDLMQYEQGHEH